MRVYMIPPNVIANVWPVASNMLGPAIDRCDGDHTLDTCRFAIEAGEYQLWLAGADGISAAGVTTVAEYPTGQRWLELMFAGGLQSQLWGAIGLESMLDFAKSQRCKGVRIYGRRGWLRRLPGLREMATVFDKVAA